MSMYSNISTVKNLKLKNDFVLDVDQLYFIINDINTRLDDLNYVRRDEINELVKILNIIICRFGGKNDIYSVFKFDINPNDISNKLNTIAAWCMMNPNSDPIHMELEKTK